MVEEESAVFSEYGVKKMEGCPQPGTLLLDGEAKLKDTANDQSEGKQRQSPLRPTGSHGWLSHCPLCLAPFHRIFNPLPSLLFCMIPCAERVASAAGFPQSALSVGF